MPKKNKFTENQKQLIRLGILTLQEAIHSPVPMQKVVEEFIELLEKVIQEGEMSREPEIVDIACEIIHQTDKAFLIYDGDKKVWIPKSVGEWDEDAKTMAMPYRWAHEKGLILMRKNKNPDTFFRDPETCAQDRVREAYRKWRGFNGPKCV